MYFFRVLQWQLTELQEGGIDGISQSIEKVVLVKLCLLLGGKWLGLVFISGITILVCPACIIMYINHKTKIVS